MPAELLSPKQVARAIGVSESSLKRWCDSGLIQTVRTAGKHRKLLLSDVLRFIRERDFQLVSPELLGLPPTAPGANLGLARGRGLLADALLAGNEAQARQIVMDLHLARHSSSVLCDQVISPAFRLIGDRWSCQQAEVYQERRGCEIALRILLDLRRLQPQPQQELLALGGTIEGDQYMLPTTMAELVLRESGWHANSLGVSIPFASLIRSLYDKRPRLFWLSVSHIREGIDFVAEFAGLSAAATEVGSALVVGGRALTPELRQDMSYAAFCDTMQQLESFAGTIRGALANIDKPAE
ncbi:MAG: helix-turn-helix domain-containing protein [Pirellulales bacterium]